MIVRYFSRAICAAAIACLVWGQDARAQQQPSAAQTALAMELLQLKGSLNAFDPMIDGAIEYHKGILLQTNPMMSKDLNDVTTIIRAEMLPRRTEIHTEMARAYASQFTEQELKDAVAFYKSPLGKKLTIGEPKALDEMTKRVNVLAEKYSTEVLTKIRAGMKAKGHNL